MYPLPDWISCSWVSWTPPHRKPFKGIVKNHLIGSLFSLQMLSDFQEILTTACPGSGPNWSVPNSAVNLQLAFLFLNFAQTLDGNSALTIFVDL